jgi:hypothetical protein
MGLVQESLRRYCLIVREPETGSSHTETSGRRDMDLSAVERPPRRLSGIGRCCTSVDRV